MSPSSDLDHGFRQTRSLRDFTRAHDVAVLDKSSDDLAPCFRSSHIIGGAQNAPPAGRGVELNGVFSLFDVPPANVKRFSRFSA